MGHLMFVSFFQLRSKWPFGPLDLIKRRAGYTSVPDKVRGLWPEIWFAENLVTVLMGWKQLVGSIWAETVLYD